MNMWDVCWEKYYVLNYYPFSSDQGSFWLLKTEEPLSRESLSVASWLSKRVHLITFCLVTLPANSRGDRGANQICTSLTNKEVILLKYSLYIQYIHNL